MRPSVGQWSPHEWASAFIKEAPESGLSVTKGSEVGRVPPGGGSSPKPNHVGILHSDSHSPELWEINSVVYKSFGPQYAVITAHTEKDTIFINLNIYILISLQQFYNCWHLINTVSQEIVITVEIAYTCSNQATALCTGIIQTEVCALLMLHVVEKYLCMQKGTKSSRV